MFVHSEKQQIYTLATFHAIENLFATPNTAQDLDASISGSFWKKMMFKRTFNMKYEELWGNSFFHSILTNNTKYFSFLREHFSCRLFSYLSILTSFNLFQIAWSCQNLEYLWFFGGFWCTITNRPLFSKLVFYISISLPLSNYTHSRHVSSEEKVQQYVSLSQWIPFLECYQKMFKIDDIIELSGYYILSGTVLQPSVYLYFYKSENITDTKESYIRQHGKLIGVYGEETFRITFRTQGLTTIHFWAKSIHPECETKLTSIHVPPVSSIRPILISML